MFEEKARIQLKQISGNEMSKYEGEICICEKQFVEVKKLIKSIEEMWRGITEILHSSEKIKQKSENTKILLGTYIKQLQLY